MTSSTSSQAVVDVMESKTMHEKPKTSTAWCSAEWRPVLSELVSTAILVLFGCMSCIPIEGLTEQSPLYAPLGFGLTVLFNVQIFGHISGAHMNPAVTLAGIIWGNTSIARGVCYVIVQVLGSTIGYGILTTIAPMDVTLNGICVTVPHAKINVIQVVGIEIVLTAILSLLCCALWDPVNQHKQDSAPVKFGLAIVGLSVVGGPLTGASMNPARSLGPAIWTGIWTVHWAYWAGPLVGAALATSLYKLIFLKDK